MAASEEISELSGFRDRPSYIQMLMSPSSASMLLVVTLKVGRRSRQSDPLVMDGIGVGTR